MRIKNYFNLIIHTSILELNDWANSTEVVEPKKDSCEGDEELSRAVSLMETDDFEHVPPLPGVSLGSTFLVDKYLIENKAPDLLGG
jgi:hypothetical protein